MAARVASFCCTRRFEELVGRTIKDSGDVSIFSTSIEDVLSDEATLPPPTSKLLLLPVVSKSCVLDVCSSFFLRAGALIGRLPPDVVVWPLFLLLLPPPLILLLLSQLLLLRVVGPPGPADRGLGMRDFCSTLALSSSTSPPP